MLGLKVTVTGKWGHRNVANTANRAISLHEQPAQDPLFDEPGGMVSAKNLVNALGAAKTQNTLPTFAGSRRTAASGRPGQKKSRRKQATPINKVGKSSYRHVDVEVLKRTQCKERRKERAEQGALSLQRTQSSGSMRPKHAGEHLEGMRQLPRAKSAAAGLTIGGQGGELPSLGGRCNMHISRGGEGQIQPGAGQSSRASAGELPGQSGSITAQRHPASPSVSPVSPTPRSLSRPPLRVLPAAGGATSSFGGSAEQGHDCYSPIVQPGPGRDLRLAPGALLPLSLGAAASGVERTQPQGLAAPPAGLSDEYKAELLALNDMLSQQRMQCLRSRRKLSQSYSPDDSLIWQSLEEREEQKRKEERAKAYAKALGALSPVEHRQLFWLRVVGLVVRAGVFEDRFRRGATNFKCVTWLCCPPVCRHRLHRCCPTPAPLQAVRPH